MTELEIKKWLIEWFHNNSSVDTEKIHTQKALEELVKNFDIDDFNIDNESLEDIIRGIYEED